MAWIQLVRTHAKMVRRIEQMLTPHHLTLPQFDVLATLSTGDGITQKELAQRLLVTKGNVCGIIDRMENNEWVIRRIDTQDRRNNHLYLTAKGRRLLQKVMPDHERLVARSVAGTDIGKLQQAYQTMDEIERNLDALEESFSE